MSKRLMLALALGCCHGLAAAAGAGEHPACTAPFSEANGWSAVELQAIAATCSDAGIGALFRARAEHRELTRELEILTQLISLNGNSDRLRLEQSRIYVGLIDAFAQAAWKRGDRSALTSAHMGYQDAMSLVERAIDGRDLAYDRP